MKQRAAAYIRVSTLDQTEFSPDAQLKQIKEYAGKHMMQLSDEHIYADEGISGRSTDKRIAFNKMIQSAKKKPRPFDVILIHKFNRFARNREDAIIFKSLLKRDCGIKVISVTEPIEDDKIGIIIESVLDAFSEYYSINLSEEVKKGMGEKASRGGVQSRPPFGYDIVDNHLVINKDEQSIVKLIYDKYIYDEKSYIDIANDLNDIGLTTKNGNRFQSKTIKYILNNPTYKGYLLWNKKEKNGVIRDQANWIIAKGNFIPIITEETYEKAQERMSLIKKYNSKNAKPSHMYKHILSGLVVCSFCGGRMVFCNNKNYSYFRCRKAKEGGCSIKKSIRAEVLEEAILEQLDKDFNYIDLLICDEELNRNSNDIQLFRQQLKSVKNKLELAKQAYLRGVDNLTEYQENKSLLLKEQELLEVSIQTSDMEKEKITKKTKFDCFGGISKIIKEEEISLDKKNKALKSFIKEIILDVQNESLEVIYYLEDYVDI